MTDLHKAIARARMALTLDFKNVLEGESHLSTVLRDLLAALDAQEPVADVCLPGPLAQETRAYVFLRPAGRGLPHNTPLFAAPPAPAVPDGYALVPVEATEAMKRSAVEAWEGLAVYKNMRSRGLADLEDKATECWEAMLAAAQPKETE